MTLYGQWQQIKVRTYLQVNNILCANYEFLILFLLFYFMDQTWKQDRQMDVKWIDTVRWKDCSHDDSMILYPKLKYIINITDSLCEISKQIRKRTHNFTFSYIYSLSKKKFELSFLSHSILFHTLTRNVNSFPYLKGPWNGVLIGKYNKSSNLMAK